jgi:hypothetical protein
MDVRIRAGQTGGLPLRHRCPRETERCNALAVNESVRSAKAAEAHAEFGSRAHPLG